MPKHFLVQSLLICLLIISWVFYLPTKALASSHCSLATWPDKVIIPPGQSNVLPDGTEITYYIKVQEQGTYNVYLHRGWALGYGVVSFENVQPDANMELKYPGSTYSLPLTAKVNNNWNAEVFQKGNHKIEVVRQGASGNFCQLNYPILKTEETQQIECSIKAPKQPNTATEIIYEGIIKPRGVYRLNILNLKTGNSFSPLDGTGNFPSQSLGMLNEGTYQIRLEKQVEQAAGAVYTVTGKADRVKVWENTNCQVQPITVVSAAANPNPDLTPVQVGSGTPAEPGSSGKTDDGAKTSAAGISCNPETGDDVEGGMGIKTAIGCVPTEPKELVRSVMRFAAGIGGAAALLLMAAGAFRMITSAGNPELIKKGGEQFQSAIIGLLFILFSVLLLKIIGVDILGLEALLNI